MNGADTAGRILPVGPVGRHGVGWNGMVGLVVTEAALFAYLLFSYFYLAATNPGGWVLESSPSLRLALPNTLLLLASSVAAAYAERGVRRQDRSAALLGTAATLLMGAGFAAIQLLEWSGKTYSWRTSAYGSLYFVTTAFHMAHVLAGLAMLALLLLWTAMRYFEPPRTLPAAIVIVYWHFVDAVWLFVFSTYYLSPYLGFGT